MANRSQEQSKIPKNQINNTENQINIKLIILKIIKHPKKKLWGPRPTLGVTDLTEAEVNKII